MNIPVCFNFHKKNWKSEYQYLTTLLCIEYNIIIIHAICYDFAILPFLWTVFEHFGKYDYVKLYPAYLFKYFFG